MPKTSKNTNKKAPKTANGVQSENKNIIRTKSPAEKTIRTAAVTISEKPIVLTETSNLLHIKYDNTEDKTTNAVFIIFVWDIKRVFPAQPF